MCSITGGSVFNETALKIFHKAKDRGRDYSNIFYRNDSWICNHRAIPTTEVECPEFNQPFGNEYKFVHNGTIANDKELGNHDGVIDSYIISKVVNPTSIDTVVETLQKVKGAYAIAILKPNGTFYLACNYKPIFYGFDMVGNFFFSSYKEHLQDCCINIDRVTPYSVMDTETGETRELPRVKYNRAIVIASAGLDSTAVAAYAKQQHEEILLLHFNYGCLAEQNETNRIIQIAERLDCRYFIMPIDLSWMAQSSSLLNGKKDIKGGIAGSEYAYEWVPARNLIMMSLAVGFAEANNYSYIYLGTNLEESGAYPDNENQFIKDLNNCLYGAVQNGKYVEIRTPVGNLMKHEIVAFGNKYNAPFDLTWSCYKDGDKPCNECGPCFMRKTAFERNGLTDPLLEEK